MASKPSPSSSSGSFDDYVRSLRAEVAAAAKVRWEDPVAFLWRARRVGEALLHAMRVRHVAGSGHEPSASIDGLLKHDLLRAKLGRENLIDLHGLQNLGNTGSHIQGEAINYEHAAVVAAAHLANVVAWFFRAQHPETAVPEDVGHALDVLRDPARWRSSPDNLARRAAERIDQLGAELRLLQETPRHSPVGGGPASSVPARISPWRAVAATLAVALAALGGGFAAVRAWGGASDSPSARAVEASGPVAATPAGQGGQRPSRPASNADVPPSEVVPVVSCPTGTVELLSWPLRLLPPPARGGPWTPRQPRVSVSVTAPRVCLEARAAAAREVLAAHPDWASAFDGCVTHRPSDSEPMPCLRHDEAEIWCRERGRRLPQLIEWEALARQPPSGSVTDGDVRGQPAGAWLEWTADSFPPTVFNLRLSGVVGWYVTRGPRLPQSRSDAEHPRYSWNRQEGANRVHSLSVRCVFDPAAPPPCFDGLVLPRREPGRLGRGPHRHLVAPARGGGVTRDDAAVTDPVAGDVRSVAGGASRRRGDAR